jgi:hypothetical protein
MVLFLIERSRRKLFKKFLGMSLMALVLSFTISPIFDSVGHAESKVHETNTDATTLLKNEDKITIKTGANNGTKDRKTISIGKWQPFKNKDGLKSTTFTVGQLREAVKSGDGTIKIAGKEFDASQLLSNAENGQTYDTIKRQGGFLNTGSIGVKVTVEKRNSTGGTRVKSKMISPPSEVEYIPEVAVMWQYYMHYYGEQPKGADITSRTSISSWSDPKPLFATKTVNGVDYTTTYAFSDGGVYKLYAVPVSNYGNWNWNGAAFSFYTVIGSNQEGKAIQLPPTYTKGASTNLSGGGGMWDGEQNLDDDFKKNKSKISKRQSRYRDFMSTYGGEGKIGDFGKIRSKPAEEENHFND